MATMKQKSVLRNVLRTIIEIPGSPGCSGRTFETYENFEDKCTLQRAASEKLAQLPDQKSIEFASVYNAFSREMVGDQVMTEDANGYGFLWAWL